MTCRGPLLMFTIALVGCSTIGYVKESPSSSVAIYPAAGGYQVRFTKVVEGRGNVHSPFEYRKYEYEYHEWLFVPASRGRVSVNGELLGCPIGFRGPYGRREIRGTITFTDSTVIVDLEQLGIIGREPRWVPFVANGESKLVVKSNLNTSPVNRDCKAS
jgi:hypothetical protein